MNEKQVEVNITDRVGFSLRLKACGGPEVHRGAWGLNQ